MHLNQGQLSAGGNKLLPDLGSTMDDWLLSPTVDGKTLTNVKGTAAKLNAVNLLSFDGNNDEVDFGQALAFGVTDSWTTEFTIEFDSTPSSFQWIVGKEGSSKGWAIRNGNSSNREKLAFLILGTNSGGSLTTDTFQTNANVLDGTLATWKVVYNGSSASFYKDGVAVASSQTTTGDVVDMSTTASATLGQRDGSSGDISADVSNLKVYNDTTTYLHAPLAEGSGTKAYDVSGNGNHGAITGTTWTTLDGIESWNHEYGFDATAVFDGTDDFIDTGVSATDQYTFEVTAKLNANSDFQGYFNTNKRFFFGRNTNTTVRFGYLTFNSTVAVANSIFDEFTNYKIQNGKLFIDGVEALDASVTPSGTTLGNLYIGARFNDVSDVADSFVNQEFKDAKIYDNNDVLVRDFVPSEDGLYDKVNGVYYSNDGTGTITTKRVPALNTTTNQIATFDGVADHVDTNTPNTSKGSYEVTFVPTIVDGTKIIAGGRTSNDRRTYIALDNESSSPRLVAGIGDKPNGSFRGTTTLTLGTRYKGKLTWDDATNNAELFLDQFDGNGFVSEATISYGSTASDVDIIVGAFNNYGSILNYFNGEIHSFIFKDGSDNTVIEYDFQSDIGTTTVQDLSTNNNDGTVTVGSGGLATFWGQRVADASGSLVSADYAAGNTTISNPLGFVHNGSECSIEFEGGTDLTKTASDIASHSNSTNANLFFAKDGNGNVIQALVYDGDLTGTALTRTRAYVG